MPCHYCRRSIADLSNDLICADCSEYLIRLARNKASVPYFKRLLYSAAVHQLRRVEGAP